MKSTRKENKTASVLIRLTKAEKQQLRKYAHENGMSYGRFVVVLMKRFGKTAVGGVIDGITG